MSGFPNPSVSLSTLLAFNNESASAIDVLNRQWQTQNNTQQPGAIYWTFFTPLQTINVSKISMNSGSAAAVGATLIRMGLYAYDETTATLLAQTANDPTLFAGTFTNYQRSFDNSVATNVTLVAGKRYGIAVIFVGTTGPGLIGTYSNQGGVNPPKVSGQLTGQSDLVASGVPTFNSICQWGRLT